MPECLARFVHNIEALIINFSWKIPFYFFIKIKDFFYIRIVLKDFLTIHSSLSELIFGQTLQRDPFFFQKVISIIKCYILVKLIGSESYLRV